MYKIAIVCLVLFATLADSAPAPLPRKVKPFTGVNSLNSTKYEFSWGRQKGTYVFYKNGTFECYLGPNTPLSKYYGNWSYREGKIWTNETFTGTTWTTFVYHIGLPKDCTKFTCDVYRFDTDTCKEYKVTYCEFHSPRRFEEK